MAFFFYLVKSHYRGFERLQCSKFYLKQRVHSTLSTPFSLTNVMLTIFLANGTRFGIQSILFQNNKAFLHSYTDIAVLIYNYV